ncbi:nucleotide exchange factor GrpE [Lentzea aerocolonigenes]|uniref:nucleotide exchange factor GrpE n=1 Tax=Lentzea aerocolonigenes TaxID=68170 RepID=UPI00055CC89C|nr:nucleotide exchange factor GrpE [Lentzea aerocolonigenes]MCP2242411.1 molecular chaperone GrpE [Lentzea aerocolonigenes]
MTTQGNAANSAPEVAAENGTGAAPPATPVPELAELEDRWLRAVAELDNVRKRYGRELDRERTAERARVASAWLPVLDNLELALGHASDDAFTEGVRAIRDQAVEVLARLGYPRQDATGVPFDPNLHEVVTVLDDPDAPPSTVVRVLRPGYGVLRPAAVAVSRAARE